MLLIIFTILLILLIILTFTYFKIEKPKQGIYSAIASIVLAIIVITLTVFMIKKPNTPIEEMIDPPIIEDQINEEEPITENDIESIEMEYQE